MTCGKEALVKSSQPHTLSQRRKKNHMQIQRRPKARENIRGFTSGRVKKMVSKCTISIVVRKGITGPRAPKGDQS